MGEVPFQNISVANSVIWSMRHQLHTSCWPSRPRFLQAQSGLDSRSILSARKSHLRPDGIGCHSYPSSHEKTASSSCAIVRCTRTLADTEIRARSLRRRSAPVTIERSSRRRRSRCGQFRAIVRFRSRPAAWERPSARPLARAGGLSLEELSSARSVT